MRRLLFSTPKNQSEPPKRECEKQIEKELDLPDVSTCCGRGCANCVWLQYAETILKHYENSPESGKKLHEALNKIDDENLKSFLLMELRHKLPK